MQSSFFAMSLIFSTHASDMQHLRVKGMQRDATRILFSTTPFFTKAESTQLNSASCSTNALLTTLAEEGRLEEALGILHGTRQQGIPLHSNTYDSLLQACTVAKAITEGRKVHNHMLMDGFDQNVYLLNKVVVMYLRSGSLVDARPVFDKIPERNILSWNAMISGYAREGFCEKALALLPQMQAEGMKPDSFIISSILPACSRLGALEHGKQIHAYVVRNGFEADVFVGSCLVDMYAKCSSIADARRVFDKMSERNVVSWNSMIAGYAQTGQLDEAIRLFDEMESAGLTRNVVTWNSMIAGYAQHGHSDEALKLFGQMKLAGMTPDLFTWNSMIAGCARHGHGKEALELFRQMQLAGLRPNVISWNSLITGYVQNERNSDALEMFHQMQFTGVKSNSITIVSVLSACARLTDLWYGKEIHGYVIRYGFNCDLYVGNALLDMYVKCGVNIDAHQYFDKMSQRDVISWTSIIASYAQNRPDDIALELFHQMQLDGIKPNLVTWNAIISGYAKKGCADKALKLFPVMQQAGIKPDVTTWNALIAGYAQNGHGDQALNLFYQMQIAGITPNVITWNAMIAGYVQNGNDEEALKLFSHMQLTGFKLDSVTLLSILPACAHLSSLEKGKEIHNAITRMQLELDLSVRNALIDMYAKCGSIQDAIQVFEKMSDRDVISWNAMIMAYGMHGDGEGALNIFHQMQQVGTKPNYITFIGVLSAFSHAGMLDEGRQYFNSMSRDYHIIPSVEHYACMVDLFARAGCLEEAYDFTNKMPFAPTVSMLGALLGACKVHCNIELAESVAERLFQLEPENSGNYALLSNIYAAASRWDDAARVRKMMRDRGLKKKPGCSWIGV